MPRGSSKSIRKPYICCIMLNLFAIEYVKNSPSPLFRKPSETLEEKIIIQIPKRDRLLLKKEHSLVDE